MPSINFEKTQYTKRATILKSKGIAYQEYLKSNEWKKARERIFKLRGKFCRVCGNVNNLNVHHNKYNEKNLNGSINALVVLCGICHEEVHRISKIRGWSYKRGVNSLRKRYKKWGDIFYYPPNSRVIEFKKD